jgi:hypothetical protein
MFTSNNVEEAREALNKCVMTEKEFDRSLYPLIDGVVEAFKASGLKEIRFRDTYISISIIDAVRDHSREQTSLSIGVRSAVPFLSPPEPIIVEAQRGIETPTRNVLDTVNMEAKKWLLDNGLDLCNELRGKARVSEMIVNAYMGQIRRLLGEDVKTAEDLVKALIGKVIKSL